MADLILASKSPRRVELLQQLGLKAHIISIDVDECVLPQEKPDEYVLRVSKEKARAGWEILSPEIRHLPVLAADTAVVLDEAILGKPTDYVDARRMWRMLSGVQHDVLSAVVVTQENKTECICQRSQVRMRDISEAEMQAYWNTGEPCDKAGAYGIQGIGALFIEHITGSYSGIMGLPLFETAQILKGFGVRVLE
ncbi:MAG: Maf family nucleotide pyrophosphatase [Gammaproteobacteria bacterium]|nr:Maf family nucleotide pyrophosphatase [Gammaproteobacteria bacterium]